MYSGGARIVGLSRKKVDSLTKNSEELSKQNKLGENWKNTIDNLFANIKKTK